jgi:hypothetical protein
MTKLPLLSVNIEILRLLAATRDLLAGYIRRYHARAAELRRASIAIGQNGQSSSSRRSASCATWSTPSRRAGRLARAHARAGIKTGGAQGRAGRQSARSNSAAPGVAEIYQRKIANLKSALSEALAEKRAEAFAIVRELVGKIVIKPSAPGVPPELEIHGRLAALLEATEPSGANSARHSGVLLVAGEGFEPPTSGL